MTVKVPIRTVYDNANNAIGLSEMQTGEVVGYQHGGTGLSTLGTSGQVLSVNSETNGLEFGDVSTLAGVDGYLQVANANVVFVTKDTALTTNNALINLINDRMQVANVQSLVTTSIDNVIASAPGTLDTLNELAAAIGDDANFITTINTSIDDRLQVANATATFSTLTQLGNTNSYIAATQTNLDTQTARINLLNNNLTSTNTAIRGLVSDRLQVANANQTFVTKSTALTTNNALINLINDRLQVANATATFVTKAVALSSNNNINSRIDATNANVNQKLGATASVTLTGDVTASGSFSANAISLTTDIAASGTPTGTFGSASKVPIITVGADGRITNISNTDVAGVTGFTYTAANNTFAISTADGGSFTASVDELENYALTSTVNATFETKSVALAANNAQNSLILDRLQVANAASLFVNVTGDTMSGALAMGTNKITGMGNPTAAQDAATKTYVDTQVANIVDSAPEALNTLNELAAALGDDASFATTTATTLGTKAANTYVNATFSTLTQLGNTNSYIATKADATTQVIAGSGLTGGGTLAASRTLNIGAGTGITVAADAISTNDGAIVHDNLSGFVADEHIAHSGVTLTAGDGLTGGGTIAASRSFNVGAGTLIDVTADAVNVDLSELSTSTTDGDGDYFVVVDTSNAQRKLTKGNIAISGFNNDAGYTTNEGDITGVTAGTNLNGGGASGSVTLNVDNAPTFSGTVAAADFNSTSDISLKENIINISNPIHKVGALRGVNFDWKESGILSMGVIAQEVEEVIPEVVSTNKSGLKTVNYDAMVGLLIEVVKDQQKQIDELKQIINNV